MLVKRIKRYSKLLVAVGFGISTPEQVNRVSKYADLVVVGSAALCLSDMNNIVAIKTSDAVMVCPTDKAQNVKKINQGGYR